MTTTQHQSVWQKILHTPIPKETKKEQYVRLYGYWDAKKPSPWKPIVESKGKRLIKGRAKGVGQFLAHTAINCLKDHLEPMHDRL
jgi:hypothetical protein